MSNDFKEVFSPDYYELLTNPDSKVIVNDIRFINKVLLSIDQKYLNYTIELKKALIKEQQVRGLKKSTADELYDKLLNMMNSKKEAFKKEILVMGHLANISNKSNIRTAVVFYNNLANIVSQQLDIAFSLITTRLSLFSKRNN